MIHPHTCAQLSVNAGSAPYFHMEAPRPVQTESNRDLSACDLLSGNAAVLLILFIASGYFAVWFILEGGGGFVKGAFLYRFMQNKETAARILSCGSFFYRNCQIEYFSGKNCSLISYLPV